MKINRLVRDFSDNSRIYRRPETADPSGLLYRLQFTGYEEIGEKYHIQRSGYESFLLSYVCGGSGNVICNGKYYHTTENSLIFVNCMEPFESWSDPDGYVICYLHFYNPHLADFCSYIQSLAAPVIDLGGDTLAFREMIRELHRSFEEDRFDEEKTSLEIHRLLLRLKRTGESSAAVIPSAPEYINRLILYIKNNLTESLTLSRCAEYAGVTPNHLEKVFRRQIGMPVKRYIDNLRLKKSEQLLLCSDLRIAEVARSVGLEDTQALIRLYRGLLGMTPGDYRRVYSSARKRQDPAVP